MLVIVDVVAGVATLLVFRVAMTLQSPTLQACLPGLQKASTDVFGGFLESLISILTMYHFGRVEY